MSGGSFNYACDFDRLKDLLGNKQDIGGIADALRSRGHEAAAEETEDLLAELSVVEDYFLARAERLRQVWKAAEWAASGDWSDDDVALEVSRLAAEPPFTGHVRIDTGSGRIVE